MLATVRAREAGEHNNSCQASAVLSWFCWFRPAHGMFQWNTRSFKSLTVRPLGSGSREKTCPLTGTTLGGSQGRRVDWCWGLFSSTSSQSNAAIYRSASCGEEVTVISCIPPGGGFMSCELVAHSKVVRRQRNAGLCNKTEEMTQGDAGYLAQSKCD